MKIFKNESLDSLSDVGRFVNSFIKKNKFYFDFSKNKRVYNSVNNFSTPSFESGAIKTLENIFPQIKYKKFVVGSLKPHVVKDKDRTELNVYARRKTTKISNKQDFSEVINYISSILVNAEVSRKDLDVVLSEIPKNTSSGFPEFCRKGSSKAVELCKNRVSKVLKSDSFIDAFKYMFKFPVTIFHRFTPKMKLINNEYSPNWKIRQIHGTPFFIVALEKLIFENFVETLKLSFPFYTVGLTKLQISDKISDLRDKARLSNKVIFCGDISGCDKSISFDHSQLYFSYAKDFICDDYINAFKALVCYHLRTPMLYSGGILVSHGSTITGSWLTSSFTTFCVTVSLFYSYFRIYRRMPKLDELLVQGDDFVILLDKKEDSILFKENMLEFNLRVRLDKSRISKYYEEIEFLGYIWDFSNEPDQTDDWIISRIVYPEKFIKFPGPLRLIYRYIP